MINEGIVERRNTRVLDIGLTGSVEVIIPLFPRAFSIAVAVAKSEAVVEHSPETIYIFLIGLVKWRRCHVIHSGIRISESIR